MIAEGLFAILLGAGSPAVAPAVTPARAVHYRRKPRRARPAIIAKNASVVAQSAPTATVRIIPIVRWPLWCERIGGLDCAEK